MRLPYDPLLAANVTVPAEIGLKPVPIGAAISNPVCTLDLTELLEPNLDEILPETGIDKLIPLRLPEGALVVVVAILVARGTYERYYF